MLFGRSFSRYEGRQLFENIYLFFRRGKSATFNLPEEFEIIGVFCLRVDFFFGANIFFFGIWRSLARSSGGEGK